MIGRHTTHWCLNDQVALGTVEDCQNCANDPAETDPAAPSPGR